MMNAETPKRSESKGPGSVLLECELEAPPEKVWRALTEPALLARWLLPVREPQPESGGHLAFAGETEGLARRIDCRVLAAEPPRRLSYGWRGNEDGERESVVTFELTESAAGGTRLKLVHDGFGTASMQAAGVPAPISLSRALKRERGRRREAAAWGEGDPSPALAIPSPSPSLARWVPSLSRFKARERDALRSPANDNAFILRCAA